MWVSGYFPPSMNTQRSFSFLHQRHPLSFPLYPPKPFPTLPPPYSKDSECMDTHSPSPFGEKTTAHGRSFKVLQPKEGKTPDFTLS